MKQLTIFDRAIAAHAKWKYRLFQAINAGKSEWTVAEVRADDRCDFGEWLEHLPVAERVSERLTRIKALHTEFHEVASEVLALALSGKKEEARAAVSLGSHFTEISTSLTMALAEWSESGTQRS